MSNKPSTAAAAKSELNAAATPVTAPAPETAPKAKAAKKAGNKPEMVEIELFRDNDKYTDDVFVSINDKTWMIKRGIRVKVPKYVAEVLEQSMAQDIKTAELISRMIG